MNTVEQTTSTWGADVVGRRVHPTIVQALAPWVNQLKNKDGTPVSAALQAQFDRTYPLKPARRDPPLNAFNYTLCGVALECELEYEDGEPGDGWNEPSYPANAYLQVAFAGNTDIFEILSDEQREEIETAFLAQREEA